MFSCQCSNILKTIMCLTKWCAFPLVCERVSLSRTPPSYPIRVQTPVTNEPVHLWKVGAVSKFVSSPAFCCFCHILFNMCCWHQIQNKQTFTKIYDVDEVKHIDYINSVTVKNKRFCFVLRCPNIFRIRVAFSEPADKGITGDMIIC